MDKRKLFISILAGIMALVMLLGLVASFIPTAHAASSSELKAELDALKEEALVGRNGIPEDIAKAALYLADATFVTGQILGVNGGFIV